MAQPGFLRALWFSLVGFLSSLFHKSPSTVLPTPATAKSPKTSLALRVTNHRKEPPPLKRTSSAASSPMSSTARTSPACRPRSITPKPTPTDPERIFHPPTNPFPNISLSGIFATPLLVSPHLAPDIELGCLSLSSPPDVHPLTPMASPGSPSPFRGPRSAASPSFHTFHSRSPPTPRTPSSAVIVRLDRSSISPTTMSDGSLEVISLGDRRGFIGSPLKVTNIGRLPSPWSPVGKTTPSDVWISVNGTLRNAAGPLDDDLAQSRDDSTALRSTILSPLTVSRISTASLYSSSPGLDALGISVFVNLDEAEGQLSNKDDDVDETTSTPKLNEVRDGNRPTIITQDPETPRKRRETLPSATGSNARSLSSRATKYYSTPLTKLDNIDISHVRSASSISSMAYEFRLGLFADGRSMTAIENIISLLDQASPEPTHVNAMQPMEVA